MASVLKVDRIETPSGTGNISLAQPISGDGSQLTGITAGTPADDSVTGAKIDLSLVAGDIMYASGVDTLERLPKGTDGEVLILASGVPSWVAGSTPADDSVTGGKIDLSLVAGDIIYSDATDSVERLPKGTDGEVLTLASGVPSWAAAGGGGGVWTQLDRGTTSGNFVTEIDITPADFDMVYNTSQGNASDYDGYKLYTTLETETDSVDYAVQIRNSSANTWTTSGYNHTVTGMMNAANYVHTKSLSQQSQTYWKPLGGQGSNNNPKSRAHQEFTMYRSRDEENGFIINCLTSFHQGVSGGECGVFSASLYIDSQSGNGIRLYASSGNIKGAYTFYGIKGS